MCEEKDVHEYAAHAPICVTEFDQSYVDIGVQDRLESLASRALGMATYALSDKKVKEEVAAILFSADDLGLWFGLR